MDMWGKPSSFGAYNCLCVEIPIALKVRGCKFGRRAASISSNVSRQKILRIMQRESECLYAAVTLLCVCDIGWEQNYFPYFQVNQLGYAASLQL